MLYQNEEPLVQRTCIKTASLQSEVLDSRKSVSNETVSKKPLSEKAQSEEISSKESEYKVPEELKLQTLICGHQVLTSLSDKSLVSICQNPNMRIQTVGYQPWTVDELRHDAAQIELCRRYRPLILHYTNRTGNREFREDVESYLWAILMESIYSFDLEGPVPFAGFVKAGVRYGYMRYWKRERLRNHREIHIPDRTTDDGDVAVGMDIFASGENIADMIMTADEEQRLRARLVWALGRLSPDQRDLLRRVYGECQSLVSVSEELNCSRQAIQRRHERAIRKLRRYLTTDFNKIKVH
ncbi:sigma-70 family RNA polymerase sigma factor [Veillonella rogosae JCM 15642]|uniref:Sigma-70 family RNA polymerase sigma factor n=2 Tax=Veillonella TaxID=29465 RepID=A0ABX5BZD6_9FIRM|nr:MULTISPECIES: sigma-70 family RNA polymerase sigma factor [Veillonella]PQL12215.1 sigma-70 family RNA polymerase sigma factor [Veillonella rogosae JCM 15642]PQL13423.1 sigma-70 family RNA polymerase sigma factor [Veillonella sp. S13053-19]